MIDCCISDSLLSVCCAEVTKGYLGHISCVLPFGLGCVVTDLILSDLFVLVCVCALNVYMLVLVHMCALGWQDGSLCHIQYLQLNAQVISLQMDADHGLCQVHIVSTHVVFIDTV